MVIGEGSFQYDWMGDWARTPASTHDNGRTHGAAVLESGEVVVFHQANPALLLFNADGELLRSFGDYAGAHGLTLHREAGQEVLWLTDQERSIVHKVAISGEILMELPRPPAEEINGGDEAARKAYIPTWAAAGPDGDIWVADGYGSHLVFRFTAGGAYKGHIDGTEGAGRFNEPHGIAFSPEGELWITDRANHRICIYDGDGRYVRHKDWICHSPCTFAFHGGEVYVPELFTGIKVLDRDLNVLASLGENPEVGPNPDPQTWFPPRAPQGWPDLPANQLADGRFNSPHGLAVSREGDIYVVEWIVGGRITKLRRR